jgi:CheY-like chemotaxis protein
VDENASGLDLLNTLVAGFGFGERLRAASSAEAIELLQQRSVDLILVEAALSKMDGFDFVHWLRRSGLKPNAYCPVILVTGHTPREKVEKARDCGASYVVAKPITPLTLIERIVFVSKDARPFVESDTYIGPDRRFKNEGPPEGSEGRRRTDLQDFASERKMSQDEIDAFLNPTKVRK